MLLYTCFSFTVSDFLFLGMGFKRIRIWQPHLLSLAVAELFLAGEITPMGISVKSFLSKVKTCEGKSKYWFTVMWL